MIVRTIKTPIITAGSHDLLDVLRTSVPKLSERSTVVVTSKIVSLCEGRTVPIGSIDKAELIRRESENYLSPENHPHAITLTIARNVLIPTAGIDESNGNGSYVLWPEDAQASARFIRSFLADACSLRDLGVIISDSHTTPMRWGTTGIALAYAGFYGLNDFIGKPDLFGRAMTVTKANVADGLAASAVLAMGESNEQTPITVITDADFVTFDATSPTDKELKEWHIPIETDLYAPLIVNAPWKKGDRT